MREISSKNGANLAIKYNFLFKETSCEINLNVIYSFEDIIIKTFTENIHKKKNLYFFLNI